MVNIEGSPIFSGFFHTKIPEGPRHGASYQFQPVQNKLVFLVWYAARATQKLSGGGLFHFLSIFPRTDSCDDHVSCSAWRLTNLTVISWAPPFLLSTRVVNSIGEKTYEPTIHQVSCPADFVQIWLWRAFVMRTTVTIYCSIYTFLPVRTDHYNLRCSFFHCRTLFILLLEL